MAAGEREARLAVIERDLTPGVHAVADLAAALRDEARHLAPVGVPVAVRTPRGREAEAH
jgi:hypothetical protein